MSVTADSAKKNLQRDENTVKIEIDGTTVHARRGEMLIEAADDAGFTIPRFCYHKKLSIAANCRMCLVEVEKVPKPLPACATPVTEGMKVYTRSPKAIEAQRGTMEFLLINHPLDCPICDQGGECELQEVSIGFGSDCSEYGENKRVLPDRDIGPLISTEMTRCIHCTRCVRFGDEVAGMRELGATGRGEQTHIGTYIEKAIASEMSGNVIDLCPVGALTSKPFRFTARVWEMSHRASIAAHDCVGSNVDVLTRRNEVMRVDPRENELLNEVWLSDRDRFSYEALNGEDRLLQPMVRQQGKWQETDWNTALEYTVSSLQKLIKDQGAEQLGALASPNSTLEEQALLAKLMRGLGSNNIDHRLRQQDFSGQQYDALYPWLGQSVAALEEQDALLLIGSNVQKDQPIIGHRIRKASLKGGVMMAVNAVDYDFNFKLQNKCIVAPAQMVAELAAIAIAAQEQQGAGVNAELQALLNGAAVGDNHRAIAEQLINAGNSTVMLGTQAIMHPSYSLLQTLAAQIAASTDSRMAVLSQGANSAGARLAGCLPHRGVAGMALDHQGLDARAMFEQSLKAYMLLNVEAECDCADPLAATNALMDAQFVVSLSAFKSKAIEKYADVILPVTPATETSGTFVNVEGLWQSFSAVVAPQGEARPAWKVLRVLGNLFDVDGFDYISSDEIRAELQQSCGEISVNNHRQAALTGAAAAVDGLERIADVPLYAVDAITRRAASLQLTADAAALSVRINSAEAGRQSLAGVSEVNVQQQGEQQRLPLVIDERVPDGCAMIAAGVAGAEELGRYGAAVKITACSN